MRPASAPQKGPCITHPDPLRYFIHPPDHCAPAPPRKNFLFNAEPTWDTTGTLPWAPTLNAPPTETTRLSLSELCTEPRIGGPLTPSVTYFAKGDHSLALGASVTSKSLGKALRAASQPRRPEPSVAERAMALIRRRRRPRKDLPSAAACTGLSGEYGDQGRPRRHGMTGADRHRCR